MKRNELKSDTYGLYAKNVNEMISCHLTLYDGKNFQYPH